MKIDRRGFIGASILAAIPSFDVIGSVLPTANSGLAANKQSKSSVVRCKRLCDPEISISHWNKPSYKISFESDILDENGKMFMELDFWRSIPVGRVLKTPILFIDDFGKEFEIVESKGSRIFLAKYGSEWSAVTEYGNGIVHRHGRSFFLFNEVPEVIFQDKMTTAEDIFGVGKFPSNVQ